MIEVVRADLSLPAHAKALISLMSEYARDPMGGKRDLSEEVKSTLASVLNQRPDVSVLLAYDNNEVVGLVTCIEGFSTFLCKPLLNVHDAIVTAAYRGQGVINTLLQEVEKIAVDSGCCKITLEVLEGNQPAQRAYSKFGFCPYQLDPKMGKAQFWEKVLAC